MKGPGERLKYDFRRVWECPVCRHRERTGGDVTFRVCACQRKVEAPHRVWMKLVQEGGRRAETPKPEPAAPQMPEAVQPESVQPEPVSPESLQPAPLQPIEPPLADPAAGEAPDLTQPIE
jgi:hypothetical protein